jgi:hypothetical protein
VHCQSCIAHLGWFFTTEGDPWTPQRRRDPVPLDGYGDTVAVCTPSHPARAPRSATDVGAPQVPRFYDEPVAEPQAPAAVKARTKALSGLWLGHYPHNNVLVRKRRAGLDLASDTSRPLRRPRQVLEAWLRRSTSAPSPRAMRA